MALIPNSPNMGHNPAGGKNPADKPAGKDDGSNVFMREVDDALRQDQLSTFLATYGKILIIVIIGGLLAFGGWIYYGHQQDIYAGERGEEYVAALDAIKANNLPGAKEALKPLGDTKQDGYRTAARMMQAAISVQSDDPKAAIAGFAQVVADDGAPQAYRDLALIRQTVVEFDDMKPQDVIARLKPLAVPGNPWFGSAGEMVAMAHVKMNKPALAGAVFLQLAEDEAVPDTIRSRARQMAGLMGIDAVDDPSAAQGVGLPNGSVQAMPPVAPRP